MPAHLIRAADLYPGAPYAYASVAPPGSLVFTAGACPIDEAGGGARHWQLRGAGPARRRQPSGGAGCSGAGLTEVLKTTVYVATADQRDLVEVWEVVHAAFEPHDPPSTLLGVSVHGYSGQLVEIEAVALTGQQA